MLQAPVLAVPRRLPLRFDKKVRESLRGLRWRIFEELHDDRKNVQPAKYNRSCYDEIAFGCAKFSGNRLLGFGNFLNDPPARGNVALASLRQ